MSRNICNKCKFWATSGVDNVDTIFAHAGLLKHLSSFKQANTVC